MTLASAVPAVLIVCALREEYKQLSLVNEGMIPPGWIEAPDPSGWLCAQGRFRTITGGTMDLIATWAPSMGSDRAQATAQRIARSRPVQALAMCGLCAGRRGEVMLGDVIVADRIWAADYGKARRVDGNVSFAPDPHQTCMPTEVVQRALALRVDPATPWLLERPEPRLEPPEKNAGFRIHVGPMATVSAVTEDLMLFPRLAQVARKVLGAEMEASGLAAMATDLRLPLVVVKGVQDHADHLKDDRYRTFAARASAEVLVDLLRRSVDVLPSRPPASAAAAVAPTGWSGSTQAQGPAPEDLLQALAACYPDPTRARSVWERAGGGAGEIAWREHPLDLWLGVWGLSIRGAAVTPARLLETVMRDHPHNLVFQRHLALIQDAPRPA